MLYITDYTKPQMDRSTRSLVESYRLKIEGLNVDIQELREDLLTLFTQLTEVQALLQQRKNDIQKILDEDRELASKAGITAYGFTQVQSILDSVEEELQQIITDTGALIESIDCGEVPTTCTFSNACDEITETQDDSCAYTDVVVTPEETDCMYCNFTTQANSATTCQVEQSDTCTVNHVCEQTHHGLPFSEEQSGCDYTIDFKSGVGMDLSCMETSCMGNVDWEGYNGVYFPNDDSCIFTCNYWTADGSGEVPSNCTFTDTSGTPCDYDSEDCTYTITIEQPDCTFNTDACVYDELGPCVFDQSNHINYACGEDITCGETVTCTNYIDDWDCSDCSEGCDYDPKEDGVECIGGDNYDPTCDELPDDDDDDGDDDGGGNVICTYIINRLFDGELLSYYTTISNENVVLGFKGGFTKKLMKEYAYGLGPSIIERLEKETDSYLTELFLTRITPVWIELRRNPKEGYKMYTKFCKDMADRYHIDYSIYPAISEYYRRLIL